MRTRSRCILLRSVGACYALRGSDRRDHIPIASMIAAHAGRSRRADAVRARLHKPMR